MQKSKYKLAEKDSLLFPLSAINIDLPNELFCGPKSENYHIFDKEIYLAHMKIQRLIEHFSKSKIGNDN